MNPMEIRSIAERNMEKCFMCQWILTDLAENGKLTGYPFDAMGAPVFPVQGKTRHLELERQSLENC